MESIGHVAFLTTRVNLTSGLAVSQKDPKIAIRNRITSLWKSSHSLEFVKESLLAERDYYFVRCDECRLCARLDPYSAPVVQQSVLTQSIRENYPDRVPCLGFVETKRSLLVLCLGCLVKHHAPKATISL